MEELIILKTYLFLKHVWSVCVKWFTCLASLLAENLIKNSHCLSKWRVLEWLIYRLAEYMSRKNINFLSLSTKKPIFKNLGIRVVTFFIPLTAFLLKPLYCSSLFENQSLSFNALQSLSYVLGSSSCSS